MARQPLGRGLSSLLGDEKPKDNILELSLDQIEPNSEQPRTRFEESALDDLAHSISSNGIVQPIVVRPNGARYQILPANVAVGSPARRLHRIPVVFASRDDKLLELALIEIYPARS